MWYEFACGVGVMYELLVSSDSNFNPPHPSHSHHHWTEQTCPLPAGLHRWQGLAPSLPCPDYRDLSHISFFDLPPSCGIRHSHTQKKISPVKIVNSNDKHMFRSLQMIGGCPATSPAMRVWSWARGLPGPRLQAHLWAARVSASLCYCPTHQSD